MKRITYFLAKFFGGNIFILKSLSWDTDGNRHFNPLKGLFQ